MPRDTPQAIGRYEILGELGRGAMGVVYRARDPVLDRPVALKMMFASAATDPEDRERFLREARSVARLQHPNIVTIYELGDWQGAPFIAMELLVGQTLSDAARAGRLPTLETRLEAVEQLCRGLAYAHSRGVVHRDVKPSNAFLLEDGTVKLVDFGIAWLEGGTFATRTGVLLGTPNYMAPEQFTQSEIDHRVDQWATGVILYELLSGARPFEAATVPQLIYQIVHTEPRDLDGAALGLPGSLVRLVATAMAKDPSARFSDLGSLEQALRAVRLGERELWAPTVSAPLPVPPTPLPRPAPPPSMSSTVAPLPAMTSGGRWTSAPVTGAVDATAVFSIAAIRESGELGEPSPLQVVLVPPDGARVIVGGVDGSVRLWSFATGRREQVLRSRMHLRTGHAALITALALTTDGLYLATGHLDGGIEVWDMRSGFELEARPRHEGAVTGLAFTPDGGSLVSTGHDSTLKVWDMVGLVAGEARRQMRRQPAEGTCLVLSSEGSQVVTGHANRSIRIHEVESGRLVATLHGHRAVPSVLAVSPDGSLLATGSRDGSVRLYRLDTKAELRRFEGHSKSVSSMVFLPDGRHLATAAQGPAVSIWSVSQDDQVGELEVGVNENAASLALVPRHARLVCGLAGGRLRLWAWD